MITLIFTVPPAVLAAGLLVNAALMRRERRERERATAPESAVAMLARWHAEGQAERDRKLTAEIEQLLGGEQHG